MASVRNRLSKSESLPSARSGGVLLALIMVTVYPLFGSNQSFSVPNDVALRIRLDDTLTSTDSQVGHIGGGVE